METLSALGSDTTLWCVHVTGPDDMVAVADYPTAVRLANRVNGFLERLLKDYDERFDPHPWAQPEPWPYSPTLHAEAVASPSPDYAPSIASLASPDLSEPAAAAIVKDGAEGLAKLRTADWQPIESAPKDGERVLLWGLGFLVMLGQWAGLGDYAGPQWWSVTGVAIVPPPTHWMPLPQPPGAQP